MDNDDVPVGRILTRREAVLMTARAGLGLAAAGWLSQFAFAEAVPTTQPQVHLIASPVLTEGPFFVDEKLNRSNLLAGTTRSSVINGSPLLLNFTVYKLTGNDHAPMKDVQVDVWHADASGHYSDESNPMNNEDTSQQMWLRGYQKMDDSGVAQFATIIPGWYMGRAPHIHFKVRQFASTGNTTAEFTSQLFFDEADLIPIYAKQPYRSASARDVSNEADGIYSERQADGTTAGSHLQLVLKKDPASAGHSAEFSIVLTDGNLHGQRNGPGGGFGGPPRQGDDEFHFVPSMP